MAANSYAPQLRPLGVGEVLDAAFKVVRRGFGTLVLCVVIIAVPLEILSTLVTASTSPEAFDPSPEATDFSATLLAGTLVGGLLSTIGSTLAAAACFRAVSGIYLGEEVGWKESLAFTSRRIVPLIVLSILYSIGTTLALIALILPAIWLSVAWALSFNALLSEKLSPPEALGRSFKLVRGHWWRTFGTLVVMGILALVIGAVLGLILGVAVDAASSSASSEVAYALLQTVVNIVISLVILPLFAAVLTIIYFDLRVRKEGFDLQLLAQGVGQDPSRHDTSAESVSASAGLGDRPTQAPPATSVPPPGAGGFAPPQAPARPASDGDNSSGDPLREPDGDTPR